MYTGAVKSEIIWLTIGALFMTFTLIHFGIKTQRDRIPDHGEIISVSGQQSVTYQRIIVAIVVFFALVSYIAMMYATIYSTVHHVLLIRYLEWLVTTPLLLIDLALLATLPAKPILLLVILDVIMISLGLAAVYAQNNLLKYSLFILSTLSMFAIFYILLQ